MALQPMAEPTVNPTVYPTITPTVKPLAEPTAPPLVLEPLFNPALDLSVGPVAVPLELRIPSLQLVAPILGVGITAQNVMDAPKGPAADPVWQTAFWYRGSGIPGEVGTATLAGHVDDLVGRPALFARLGDLRVGDLIVVHDARTGQDARFIVEKSETYSTRQAADPAILAQIYGHGPASGQEPQPAPDGLAHLTLITCAGDFVDGTFDLRLVVYAARSQ
ncbi:MAG: sortase [Caldilineaceae bacterium]|nr:sortase [Caldilineaceae bacterium]MBP8109927.1 sortase [Caldilineaceae bacterium]MBP8123987.1 sortase [Caldilineaceae bacterium]MBP9074018.1 sortase [Caldilineaceae bacterium]